MLLWWIPLFGLWPLTLNACHQAGICPAVLIQSSRGNRQRTSFFLCDLTGFKFVTETKQRLDGFHCAQDVLLKNPGYSLKEVNSDWIFALNMLTRLQWHWNPCLPSVMDWIFLPNILEWASNVPSSVRKNLGTFVQTSWAHLTENLPLKWLWLL